MIRLDVVNDDKRTGFPCGRHADRHVVELKNRLPAVGPECSWLASIVGDREHALRRDDGQVRRRVSHCGSQLSDAAGVVGALRTASVRIAGDAATGRATTSAPPAASRRGRRAADGSTDPRD